MQFDVSHALIGEKMWILDEISDLGLNFGNFE